VTTGCRILNEIHRNAIDQRAARIKHLRTNRIQTDLYQSPSPYKDKIQKKNRENQMVLTPLHNLLKNYNSRFHTHVFISRPFHRLSPHRANPIRVLHEFFQATQATMNDPSK
jgi:hypothetical protein